MPRFSLKTLLIAVGVFAVSLGAWSMMFRKDVHFRPPRSDDRTGDWDIRRPLRADEEVRSVAFASGRFDQEAQLIARLFMVQMNEKHQQFELVLEPVVKKQVIFPSTYETTFFFRTDEKTSEGSSTNLDWRSELFTFRASGSGSHLPNIPARYTYSYTRTITPGRPFIVYGEGDTPITANRDMKILDFANSHPGNYSVLVAELR
jgi:hypothetical protein